MRLAKRITALEAKRQCTGRSLDHLSDEELDAYALDLIRRFEADGVVLPDDWREQYARSEIRFLEWLESEAKAMIACDV